MQQSSMGDESGDGMVSREDATELYTQVNDVLHLNSSSSLTTLFVAGRTPSKRGSTTKIRHKLRYSIATRMQQLGGSAVPRIIFGFRLVGIDVTTQLIMCVQNR